MRCFGRKQVDCGEAGGINSKDTFDKTLFFSKYGILFKFFKIFCRKIFFQKTNKSSWIKNSIGMDIQYSVAEFRLLGITYLSCRKKSK